MKAISWMDDQHAGKDQPIEVAEAGIIHEFTSPVLTRFGRCLCKWWPLDSVLEYGL